MSIWTRITEALAALAKGEPLSVVFDKLRSVPPAEQSVGFTIAVLALGAKMAKADGTVTRDEVTAFRRIFTFPEGEEGHAAHVFNLARQDVAGFDAYARKIARLFNPDGHSICADDHHVLVDILEASALSEGVEVVVDARALALVQDGGRIVGVVVRIDNQPRFVKAEKGVVLATGGFVFNEAMRRKHCPDTFKLNDPIGDKDDGGGIELGLGAGGDAIHMDQFFTTCPWTMPESHAYGVFVNVQGQRFINEDCYHGRVSRCAVDQPGGKVYLLLDMAHFVQPMDFARISIAGTGDSWEEVEAELEMPKGTLSATMAVYNEHAREGRDPLFGKRAPILTPLDQGPFVALELNFQSRWAGCAPAPMAKCWGGMARRFRGCSRRGAARPACRPGGMAIPPA